MQCDLVHVNGLWIFYGIRLTKWYHVGERKIGQSGQTARCSSAGKSLGNWHDLLNACLAVCVCGGVKQGIKSSPVLCDEMESQHRDRCRASALQRTRAIETILSWSWICFSTLAVAWLVPLARSVCLSVWFTEAAQMLMCRLFKQSFSKWSIIDQKGNEKVWQQSRILCSTHQV